MPETPIATPGFIRSQLQVLDFQPWRWTTAPVYGNGPLAPPTTAGVKQTLNGVFVMLSDALVDYMKETMTAAEKTQVSGWVNRYTAAQAGEWHVPVWSGQDSAVYLRIPAGTWASPTTPPPANVKRFFRKLFSE